MVYNVGHRERKGHAWQAFLSLLRSTRCLETVRRRRRPPPFHSSLGTARPNSVTKASLGVGGISLAYLVPLSTKVSSAVYGGSFIGRVGSPSSHNDTPKPCPGGPDPPGRVGICHLWASYYGRRRGSPRFVRLVSGAAHSMVMSFLSNNKSEGRQALFQPLKLYSGYIIDIVSGRQFSRHIAKQAGSHLVSPSPLSSDRPWQLGLLGCPRFFKPKLRLRKMRCGGVEWRPGEEPGDNGSINDPQTVLDATSRDPTSGQQRSGPQ